MLWLHDEIFIVLYFYLFLLFSCVLDHSAIESGHLADQLQEPQL